MVLAQPRCLCIPATAGVMEEQWRIAQLDGHELRTAL
jgi:hypothetical protein